MSDRPDILIDLRREAADAGRETLLGRLLLDAADEIQELTDEIGRMRLRLHSTGGGCIAIDLDDEAAEAEYMRMSRFKDPWPRDAEGKIIRPPGRENDV